MKLFGRCKGTGECVCGRCADAPVNQNSAVTVRFPDGRVEVRPPDTTYHDGFTGTVRYNGRPLRKVD